MGNVPAHAAPRGQQAPAWPPSYSPESLHNITTGIGEVGGPVAASEPSLPDEFELQEKFPSARVVRGVGDGAPIYLYGTYIDGTDAGPEISALMRRVQPDRVVLSASWENAIAMMTESPHVFNQTNCLSRVYKEAALICRAANTESRCGVVLGDMPHSAVAQQCAYEYISEGAKRSFIESYLLTPETKIPDYRANVYAKMNLGELNAKQAAAELRKHEFGKAEMAKGQFTDYGLRVLLDERSKYMALSCYDAGKRPESLQSTPATPRRATIAFCDHVMLPVIERNLYLLDRKVKIGKVDPVDVRTDMVRERSNPPLRHIFARGLEVSVEALLLRAAWRPSSMMGVSWGFILTGIFGTLHLGELAYCRWTRKKEFEPQIEMNALQSAVSFLSTVYSGPSTTSDLEAFRFKNPALIMGLSRIIAPFSWRARWMRVATGVAQISLISFIAVPQVALQTLSAFPATWSWENLRQSIVNRGETSFSMQLEHSAKATAEAIKKRAAGGWNPQVWNAQVKTAHRPSKAEKKKFLAKAQGTAEDKARQLRDFVMSKLYPDAPKPLPDPLPEPCFVKNYAVMGSRAARGALRRKNGQD